jgi:hypothetical protein
MELQQNFSLVFNNSLTIAQDRWSIKQYDDANWFVNFQYVNGKYIATYRSLRYYFGSVEDTRFSFDRNKLVYDPLSGKILQDFISVLATNTQPNSNNPLSKAISVNIVGQTVESDGYINDFEVEVASNDINNRGLIINPDFFQTVTGYTTGGANTAKLLCPAAPTACTPNTTSSRDTPFTTASRAEAGRSSAHPQRAASLRRQTTR